MTVAFSWFFSVVQTVSFSEKLSDRSWCLPTNLILLTAVILVSLVANSCSPLHNSIRITWLVLLTEAACFQSNSVLRCCQSNDETTTSRVLVLANLQLRGLDGFSPCNLLAVGIWSFCPVHFTHCFITSFLVSSLYFAAFLYEANLRSKNTPIPGTGVLLIEKGSLPLFCFNGFKILEHLLNLQMLL